MLKGDVVILEELRDPAHAMMVICSNNGMFVYCGRHRKGNAQGRCGDPGRTERDPAHAVMVICSNNGMFVYCVFVSVELAVPGL